MIDEELEHRRRSIRLKGYDYSTAGGYYVTAVAFHRECLFGEIVDGEMQLNDLGRIVEACWSEIPSHFPNVEVDAFVIMPNHIHGIIMLYENIRSDANASDRRGTIPVGATHASPLQKHDLPCGPKPRSLGAIVGSLKSAVTRRANRELHSANIWQRNYYEHIIRVQKDYEHIAGYILANPSNWTSDEENPTEV